MDGQGQQQAEKHNELKRLEPGRAMPDDGSCGGSGSAGLVQFSCLWVNLPQPPRPAHELVVRTGLQLAIGNWKPSVRHIGSVKKAPSRRLCAARPANPPRWQQSPVPGSCRYVHGQTRVSRGCWRGQTRSPAGRQARTVEMQQPWQQTWQVGLLNTQARFHLCAIDGVLQAHRCAAQSHVMATAPPCVSHWPGPWPG